MMIKSENPIQAELKQLLQDIYIIGQESESIHTIDFIKEIESKLLSLLSFKNCDQVNPFRDDPRSV